MIIRKLRFWIQGAMEDVDSGLQVNPNHPGLAKAKQSLQSAQEHLNSADPNFLAEYKQQKPSKHKRNVKSAAPRIGAKFQAEAGNFNSRGFESQGAEYPDVLMNNPPGGGIGD